MSEARQQGAAGSVSAGGTASIPGAAAILRPLLERLLGSPLPVAVDFWDGSTLGRPSAPGRLHVRSPRALARLLWSPDELGVARAFVAGDLEAEGDVFAVLAALDAVHPRPRDWAAAVPALLGAARRLGVLGLPPPPPPEEARPAGWRHSHRRDTTTVRHHYDVGNDFYRIVLGPSLTYSCARFARAGMDLEAAQASKHELVCRKLGLPERPGARLLDVGCGWGSMAIHAAARHGARVVGITLSPPQAELARRRVRDAGLSGQVDIEVRDYRDLGRETFDAISSIGMFEHVGLRHAAMYFRALARALRPGGRLLNHAISSPGGSRLPRRSFIYRYVFPDGELHDVGHTVLAAEEAGLEVRDVESLREHYAATLRAWVANLDAHWDEAVSLVGERRARVWRLYMAGSANNFERGGVSVHQVLAVACDERGRSAMPPTRAEWERADGERADGAELAPHPPRPRPSRSRPAAAAAP